MVTSIISESEDIVEVFQPEVENKPEKPNALPVLYDAIPEGLKARKLWVVWAYVWVEGRWTKVPYQPIRASDSFQERTGHKFYPAKSNDPNTWSEFEDVAAFHARHPLTTDGIGVMLQDGLLGVDLDKCRDKTTGTLQDWGNDLITRGDCYTEVSPSGTGAKLFMAATLESVSSLPEFQGQSKYRKQTNYASGRVEVYDHSSARFFTVTGHRLGEVTTIESRQDQFNDIYKTVFANLGKKPTTSAASSGDGGCDDFGFGSVNPDDLTTATPSSWLKRYKGDLRTLDIQGLWVAAGLTVIEKDDETLELTCPNRKQHSDPEAWGGTVAYIRPGDYPKFHCGRSSCRDGMFTLREALATFPADLVDAHCSSQFGSSRCVNDDGVDLPEIIVGGRQLPHMTADAIAAIEQANNPPKLFKRGGAVVRMSRDADTGILGCEPLSDAAMRGHIARVASWKRWAGSGEKAVKVDTLPPDHVVDDLLSFDGWKLPSLSKIIDTPVFADDGRLIVKPGYDSATRLYYDPGDGLDEVRVPVSPTRDDVTAAVSLLMDDMLGEFPFVTQGDKANCLAFLLLPAVRAMIAGPTPMHVIEATKQGTGKSRLAEMWGLIWLGRLPSLASECHDESEWSKTIGAALLSGAAYFFLDNVKYALKSGALAAALTSGSHRCRVLGASRMVDLPVSWVWCVSGNNLKADADITRRFIRCRLDANCENPHLRQFKIADILGWCRDRRSALVSACLTIVQSWIVAGKPKGNVTFGSYESWSGVMGGILDNAGIPGFLDNLGDTDEVNTVDAEWRAFIGYWGTTCGDNEVTIKDVFGMAVETDMLCSIRGDGGEQSQKIKLGHALTNRLGQIWGGWKLTTVKDEHGKQKFHRKGGALYQLLRMDSPNPPDHEVGTVDTSTPTTASPETTTTASPETTTPSTTSTPEAFEIGDVIQTTRFDEVVMIVGGTAESGFAVQTLDGKPFRHQIRYSVEGNTAKINVADISGRVPDPDPLGPFT